LSAKYKKIRINGKLVPEHLVVARRIAKRDLNPSEVVHHINGDEKDNRAENLMILPSRKAHSVLAGVIGRFLEEHNLVPAFREWYSTAQWPLEEAEEKLRLAQVEMKKLKKQAERYEKRKRHR